ncbi:uncharacterized protein TNCV_1299701 [Trichonephila clavipes]|nr:uncharacterized protein TNCV_1299701 [Trichonephila clavipes]
MGAIDPPLPNVKKPYLPSQRSSTCDSCASSPRSAFSFGWERNDLCFRIGSDHHHNVPNGIFSPHVIGAQVHRSLTCRHSSPLPLLLRHRFSAFLFKKDSKYYGGNEEVFQTVIF